MRRVHTTTTIQKELRTISASLLRLSTVLGMVVPTEPIGTHTSRRGAEANVRPARPTAKRVSPARRRAMKLQGRYISAVRLLSTQQKKQVRALREEKGVEAAIALAVRLRG